MSRTVVDAEADWLALPSSDGDDASPGPNPPGRTEAVDGKPRQLSARSLDEHQLRFVRCRAADYFRAAGLEDPDVLAAASQHAVRVAVRSLRDWPAPSAIARFPRAVIATADAMRRRMIRRLDASLPGPGGASRRAELSMRLASVLAERPECLLEKRLDGEVISLTRSQELQGFEMPTETPAPFPPQSLVATGSNRLLSACRASLRWCGRLILIRSRKAQ